MSRAPLVSILLPTCNRERYVGEAIASVLAQTFTDFELLILDDGSTDGTRDVIAGFDDPRIRFFPLPRAERWSVNANIGLRLARGRLIAYFNDDDRMAPEKLERQVAYLADHPEVGGVFTWLTTIDGDGNPLPDLFKQNRRVAPAAMADEILAARWFPVAPSALLRRALFDRVGGFNPELRRQVDRDLWLRMLRYFTFHVIEEPLTDYRWHGGNLTAERGQDAQVLRNHRFTNAMMRVLRAFPDGVGDDPRDSVVIVTHDALATLPRCLASLAAAVPPEGLELVVVDNGSADGTAAFLRYLRHALAHLPLRFQLILNGGNEGFARACNQGIAASRGERVLLLNPDAVVGPELLVRLRAHLGPGVGAVGPLCQHPDADGQALARHLQLRGARGQVPLSALHRALATSLAGQAVPAAHLLSFCKLLPRAVLEAHGPLDEQLFLGYEDLALDRRLGAAGLRLLVARDVYVHHLGTTSLRASGSPLVARSAEAWARADAAAGEPGQAPAGAG